MTNKGKGIAALIGLGVSALAVFGYKKLPKDQKDKIKSTLNDAGEKIKETAGTIEDSVTDTYNKVAGNSKDTAKETKEKLEKELDKATA